MISTDLSSLKIICLKWINPHSSICDRRDCDFLITSFEKVHHTIMAQTLFARVVTTSVCIPSRHRLKLIHLGCSKLKCLSFQMYHASLTKNSSFFGRQQACCSTLIICKEDKKLLEENVMLTSVKSSTSFCSCPHFLGAEDIQVWPLTQFYSFSFFL